jgi:hypothetical protein
MLGNPLYYPDISVLSDPEKQTNLATRKSPYLELESANAVKFSNIYADSPLPDSYVLADMYKQVKHRMTGKQIGMPILYYKANKLGVGNDPDSSKWFQNTYNAYDTCNALGIVSRTTPFDGTAHPLFVETQTNNTANLFYSKIQNPNFPGPPARPYRAESFLLHSAGEDGLYGTMDDMFNFDQDN